MQDCAEEMKRRRRQRSLSVCVGACNREAVRVFCVARGAWRVRVNVNVNVHVHVNVTRNATATIATANLTCECKCGM